MNEMRAGKMFTANDAMRFALSQYAAGELVKKREVWRRNLSGKSVYHFCPYCMKRLGVGASDLKKYFAIAGRKGRKSEEEAEFLNSVADKCLVPLDTVRNKLLIKYPSDKGNYGVVAFETKWACPMCKRELSEDDFTRFYAVPPDPDAGEKKILNLDSPDDMANF